MWGGPPGYGGGYPPQGYRGGYGGGGWAPAGATMPGGVHTPQHYGAVPTHVQQAEQQAQQQQQQQHQQQQHTSPTQSRSAAASPVPIVDIPDSDHEGSDAGDARRGTDFTGGGGGGGGGVNGGGSGASGGGMGPGGGGARGRGASGSAADAANGGATAAASSPSSRTITIPRDEVGTTVNIIIVFHSPDFRVWRVAEAVRSGVREVRGASVSMYQVPEILDAGALERCGYRDAKSQFAHIPTLTLNKLHLLKEADGIVLGFSPSFGQVSAEMKSLFEWMGELWIAGSLHDRVASVFAAASTQAAGQELAVISTLAALLQFGMVAVGIPGDLQQPFGVMAGGDGQGGGPSPVELEAARAQGRHVAEIAMRLKRGARAPGGGISRS